MATISWRDGRTLKQHMLLGHDGFDVFQLMRLLLAEPASTLPMSQRLRFRADLSSAFPAREFSRLTLSLRGSRALENSVASGVENALESGMAQASPDLIAADVETAANEVVELRTANFCIASVLGPLPEPFTEWVRDLSRARAPAMADFFDIFNQRLNLLRFQFKQAQTPGLNSLAPEHTRLAENLAALMGLGTPGLEQQLPLSPRAWLALAGLLSNQRKSAATIVHVLRMALNTEVSLQPMVGGWQVIDSRDRIGLGGKNAQLGQKAVLGRRVWDQQARIRLVITALDYANLCRLLPPMRPPRTQAQLQTQDETQDEAQNETQVQTETQTQVQDDSYFANFACLLNLLLDSLVDCEVELQAREASIPAAHLSRTLPLRLGQTAWLHRTPQSSNAANPSNLRRNVRYMIYANKPMTQ